MVHLVDANVLITAKNTYYQMDRVPEFWEWLVHQGQQGNVKIPQEIIEELRDGNDDLAEWIRQDHVTAALKLVEDVDIQLVRRVMDEGYAPDLVDDELERVGRDPFLVAHALAYPDDRTVVTTENSKPRRVRGNRHLPDVCADFDIDCCNTFEMTERLDFSTRWNN